MGGLACWARFSALVPFDAAPIDPVQIPKFDEGMRAFWAGPDSIESLIAQLQLKSAPPALSDVMKMLCKVLKQPLWSHDERVFLFTTAESLYE